MGKWTDRPVISDPGALAGNDTVLMALQSRPVGDRDVQVPNDTLRAYLGAGITVGVAQVAHGLSVGDLVRFDGTDYVLATADTAANAEAVGVVTSTPDLDSLTYQTAGMIGTLSGLTPGTLYYLQDDGSLGTSSGTVDKPVLIATSATTAVLILAISGAGGGGASDFVGLTDTPGSYSGAGGKLVAVNAGATALEFVAAPSGGSTVSINAQTGTTYTLVLADAGKLVTLNNASPVALTVPTNASVAYPVGTVIALAQLGAGLVTVAGASGVTINGVTPGDDDLTGQWATASLTQLATDTWLLSGGVA